MPRKRSKRSRHGAGGGGETPTTAGEGSTDRGEFSHAVGRLKRAASQTARDPSSVDTMKQGIPYPTEWTATNRYRGDTGRSKSRSKSR